MSEQPPPGLTVLVVDDVSDIRLSCRFMLETGGFRVLDAPDVRNALRCLDREKVDVLLTDLYMPLDDGVELIRTIRERPRPHPVIIAMSGEPHGGYRSSLQAARSFGADFALVKPFAGDDLLRTIHSLLGGGPTESPEIPPYLKDGA